MLHHVQELRDYCESRMTLGTRGWHKRPYVHRPRRTAVEVEQTRVHRALHGHLSTALLPASAAAAAPPPMAKGGGGGTFGGDLYPKPLGCDRPLLPFALLKRRGQGLEAQAPQGEPAAPADVPVHGADPPGRQHAPAGPAAGGGRQGPPPPAPAPAPGSPCQAHGLLACASCKRLRRAARDCCQRGHHAVGHVVRRPMTERCEDHSMPACLDCARHQRGVRHCCPRHHRGQDSSPGGCSGPQISVAKRARSASAMGLPKVAEKRRRQQEGQRELIDLTIDEPPVSAPPTKVRGRASAGCGGMRDGAHKRARTAQPVRNVSLQDGVQQRPAPERPPALHLGAPPEAEPAPLPPPPRTREGGGRFPKSDDGLTVAPPGYHTNIPTRARDRARSQAGLPAPGAPPPPPRPRPPPPPPTRTNKARKRHKAPRPTRERFLSRGSTAGPSSAREAKQDPGCAGTQDDPGD